MYEIIKYFPVNIYNILLYTFERNSQIEKNIQEIRIRVNRPIILKMRQADVLIEYTVSQKSLWTTAARCSRMFSPPPSAG